MAVIDRLRRTIAVLRVWGFVGFLLVAWRRRTHHGPTGDTTKPADNMA
jgi:hypothetical protein